MARRPIHEVKAREGLDLLLLVVFFVVGAAGTVSLKILDLPLLFTALFPAAVLIGYAFACLLTRRLTLEPETIGDNCYYLGFLFTLVSLAAALYQLNEADIASGDAGGVIPSVISSFGIALTSTIVGVFLRILLMQMRPDVVARDREARRDLAHGVRDFRQALVGVSRDLKSVSVEMAQHAAEREAKIVEITEKLTAEATELIDRQAQGFDRHMRSFSEELLANLSRTVSEETVKALSALKTTADQLASAVRETAEVHETKVGVIREANSAIADAMTEFKNVMSSHQRAALGSYRTLEARAEKIASALDSAVEALGSGTSMIDRAMQRQHDALEDRTTQLTDRLGSVDAALQGVTSRLNELDVEAVAREAAEAFSRTVAAERREPSQGVGVAGEQPQLDPSSSGTAAADRVEQPAGPNVEQPREPRTGLRRLFG